MENTEQTETSDKEIKKKVAELENIIERHEKKATPGFLRDLQFKSKVDREVFDRLPLSDFEKEIMIREIYIPHTLKKN